MFQVIPQNFMMRVRQLGLHLFLDQKQTLASTFLGGVRICSLIMLTFSYILVHFVNFEGSASCTLQHATLENSVHQRQHRFVLVHLIICFQVPTMSVCVETIFNAI
jgi:hypothetical protein